uniref:Uncharacterized protein n=3 Tax=Aegilops tauschii subsp. strangulata TaxID=200361 RepID=A0A453GF04_AEGTS
RKGETDARRKREEISIDRLRRYTSTPSRTTSAPPRPAAKTSAASSPPTPTTSSLSNSQPVRPKEPLRRRRGRQRRLRRPLLRRPARPRVPHLQPLRWVPESDQGDGEQQGDDHALLHLRQGVIVAADSRASMGGYTSLIPTCGTMACGAADCQFWHRNLG